MTRPSPDPFDRIIGANMRRLRRAKGMSQAELGACLPVTFQQIQKYEKGLNSVSASALAICAVALGCSITEFFEVR